MSFVLLGSLLALAVHLAASLAASAAVAATLPFALARLRRCGPRTRAAACCGLALLPAGAGLAAVLAVLAPAWIAHEPWGRLETPGPLLTLLALLGALLLTLRLGAGARALRRGARAVASWTARGDALPGLPLAATRFEHELPIAAVSGLLRPRLLLAGPLLRALDRGELQAVVAHELGHLAARDNLWRLLLALSPDPLAWSAGGACLRREFERAAEEAADRHACGRVPALELARALLKVAALVPPARRLELPLAAFDDGGPLASRVRALLSQAGAPARAASEETSRRPWAPRVAILFAALALALTSAAATRPEVHRLLETLVRY